MSVERISAYPVAIKYQDRQKNIESNQSHSHSKSMKSAAMLSAALLSLASIGQAGIDVKKEENRSNIVLLDKAVAPKIDYDTPKESFVKLVANNKISLICDKNKEHWLSIKCDKEHAQNINHEAALLYTIAMLKAAAINVDKKHNITWCKEKVQKIDFDSAMQDLKAMQQAGKIKFVDANEKQKCNIQISLGKFCDDDCQKEGRVVFGLLACLVALGVPCIICGLSPC